MSSINPRCFAQINYYDNLQNKCPLCADTCKICTFLDLCISCYSGYFLVDGRTSTHTQSEDASAFLNKKLKIRKNTYNSELLKDFNRMQDSTKTWFSQQPNLDIYYVSDVEKLSDFI